MFEMSVNIGRLGTQGIYESCAMICCAGSLTGRTRMEKELTNVLLFLLWLLLCHTTTTNTTRGRSASRGGSQRTRQGTVSTQLWL